jgi:hypothetical protein
MGEETHPWRRSNTTFSSHTRTADLHTVKIRHLRSLVKPHGAFMHTEVVRIETVLYSSLRTDNVTFITYQIGSFNCDVCIQAARTQSVDCRLPDADVSDSDRARNMWITRKP